MRLSVCLIVLWLATVASIASAQNEQPDNPVANAFFSAHKVVFLGDSITWQGEFLATLEESLIANGKPFPKILNFGLQSETCSGDSEPAHPWPRPNVHERLGRLLEKVQPDLLVVNFGMNDGIYHPFDQTRFENYQAGINKIIEAADNSGGKLKVILVTPPPFDALPLKQKGALVGADAKSFSWTEVYENYDEDVLAVYANWILEQKDRVAGCIDLRTPMLADLARRRESNPDFFYAADGVHVDSQGHKLIGQSIAEALGVTPSQHSNAELFQLIRQRQCILRDSGLETVGHKRPNVKKGLPPEEAAAEAAKLNERLAEIVDQQKQTQDAK
ncbi:GDSL-type esterase/lipase family protein [Mariniblastus fucicola]|uniref:GDSL-like Lipase/Acylhydrolase n=1 Tax=Mariniblastus fucicola TaxID=980251 RepID=A0A5B9PDT5_9BACT|nr:GDSL-type esterase/lipase family protein [Mariniblastus fucicola]QEG22736.1 GDSL-like Lipase/Acylhydrolase [Mariniblastus fucicola]